ncbi:MAG: capsular biosynthesis protein [Thiotrichales bacterium]|nr:capsular biosynthesis protein [Thiotrichales bacterium]
MKRNDIGDLNGKRVLFLQGPMGFFFKKLDKLFRKKGAITFRIGFNAGDQFFSYRDNYTPYRKKRKYWQRFISQFLEENQIEQIYLFGDCRFYQSQAIYAAAKLDVEVFVFEEGYVRPHFITLEKYGVNDNSRIRRDREYYDSFDLEKLPEVHSVQANYSQLAMILSAMTYYFMGNVFHYAYPYYRHHRDFSGLKEAFYGIRSFVRKQVYKIKERNKLERITNNFTKDYFFVPLQTHNDFQILKHSGYPSIEKFIIEVIESFAQHAPKDVCLMFKHHPVDRGRKEYTPFIEEQAAVYGVLKRVCVVHDVYLPDCLKHAKGTITVNSTVGLSSIFHGTPTLVMGLAIYDMKGLTNYGVSLAHFWQEQVKPDPVLFEKYRRYLVYTSQLNGSFYGMMPSFDKKVYLSDEAIRLKTAS